MSLLETLRRLTSSSTREDTRYKVDPYFAYLLLLMNILAQSGFAMRSIIKLVADTNLRDDIKRVFQKVIYLVEKWNYELREACRVVARQVRGGLGSLLTRIANAIDLGIEPRDYFSIEYEIHMSHYTDEHERRADRLRRLADAYSALMSAISFLSITAILLMMLYKIANYWAILGALLLGSLVPLVMIVLLAYKTMPPVPLIITRDRPPLIDLAERSCTLIPALIALTALLYMSLRNVQDLIHPVALALAVPGIVALLLGFIGARAIKKVKRIDEEILPFIKSFCDAYEVTQSIVKTLDILRMHDYGLLNEPIRKMHACAKLRINLDVIFKQFAVTTLSERVRILMEILKTCITSGVAPKELSKLVTTHMVAELNLAKRREQVASYLTGLVIPLQASQAAVAGLAVVLVSIFNEVLSLATTVGLGVPMIGINLAILNPVPQEVVNTYFLLQMTACCLTSAIMLYVARGEARSLILYYLGLLLVLSAGVFQLTYLLMSYMLKTLLSKVLTFGSLSIA